MHHIIGTWGLSFVLEQKQDWFQYEASMGPMLFLFQISCLETAICRYYAEFFRSCFLYFQNTL